MHLLKPGLSLVRGWERMQGFVFRDGDPRFVGQSAAEALKAAVAEQTCLMVNRNAGAGTRILIDRLLAGARPPGYANQPRSHNAVAAAVAQNRADWGIAIESVAQMYGLGFLPIAPEHYDFLSADSRRERPAVQAFLAALRDPAVRAAISAVGMRAMNLHDPVGWRRPDPRADHGLSNGAIARPWRTGAGTCGLGRWPAGTLGKF